MGCEEVVLVLAVCLTAVREVFAAYGSHSPKTSQGDHLRCAQKQVSLLTSEEETACTEIQEAPMDFSSISVGLGTLGSHLPQTCGFLILYHGKTQHRKLVRNVMLMKCYAPGKVVFCTSEA